MGPDGCGGVIPSWVFNVTTSEWVPADKGSFSCDKATGYYLSPKYVYDKRTGWYQIMPPTPANEPKPEYLLTVPDVVHTVLGDLVVGSQDYKMAQALGLLDEKDGIAISGTGAGSNNQGTIDNSGQTWLDLTNLVNVINTLQSTATSGDVAATSNTQSGDAISGAATVIANIFNLLASAWSWSNGNLNFFMKTLCNFNQTCTGDVNLNPTQNAMGGGGALGGNATTANTGADSNNDATINNSSSLDVNAKNTGNIVNNVDLLAQSGDASANKNTSAGDVTTGEALAQINIINLINSFINSGSSFFGILNIYGNLNGDILFPTGFLNGAVSSNGGGSSASLSGTGPDSNNQAGVTANGQTTINNSAYNGINNNIETSAASGSATAGQNSEVASAPQSGSATTTQGLFNLANSSVFGDNAVLVIVNVLGHWVGKIMQVGGGNASSSALLTGNAQVGSNVTGPSSTNQTAVNNTANTNINQESVGTITNNVKVGAQSGDASATENTSVGDVTSGNAKASSSVANIFNTILNVKHWFGVLVINVLGEWVGEVNNNTAAGGALMATAAQVSHPETSASNLATNLANVQVTPGSTIATTGKSSGNVAGAATTVTAGLGATPQVLTAAAEQQPAKVAAAAKTRDMTIVFGLSAIMMLMAGALASIDKKLKRR